MEDGHGDDGRLSRHVVAGVEHADDVASVLYTAEPEEPWRGICGGDEDERRVVEGVVVGVERIAPVVT